MPARVAGRALNRTITAVGGYGGDFATMLASLERLRRADVVFSTVDTVGIPLSLLAHATRLRTPVVYAAIGLPERLEQRADGLRSRAPSELVPPPALVVAYGWGEVDALRDHFGEAGPTVTFVPFGVDTEYFRPQPFRTLDADVVSVGADPRRDFELFLELARRLPDRSFQLIASGEHARALGAVPANVRVEEDVPFSVVRDRLAGARVVVLPVRDNTYSGATTTLLQAMASGKPVVVTRTAAIARGYHLEDGANCRLVPAWRSRRARAGGRRVCWTTPTAPESSGLARGRPSSSISRGGSTRTRSASTCSPRRGHLRFAREHRQGAQSSRSSDPVERRVPFCARSRRRSTSSAPAAEGVPISRSSTSSYRLPRAAGTSSCERSWVSSSGAG